MSIKRGIDTCVCDGCGMEAECLTVRGPLCWAERMTEKSERQHFCPACIDLIVRSMRRHGTKVAGGDSCLHDNYERVQCAACDRCTDCGAVIGWHFATQPPSQPA